MSNFRQLQLFTSLRLTLTNCECTFIVSTYTHTHTHSFLTHKIPSSPLLISVYKPKRKVYRESFKPKNSSRDAGWPPARRALSVDSDIERHEFLLLYQRRSHRWRRTSNLSVRGKKREGSEGKGEEEETSSGGRGGIRSRWWTGFTLSSAG